jgi:hypothetical protein
MSMIHRLLAQLKSRGLEVKPGNEPGQLLLSGPVEERTPEVMEALKKFKPQLLALFAPTEPKCAPVHNPEPEQDDGSVEPEPEPESTCRTCGKDVTDPETRARMVDPVFCTISAKSYPETTDAFGRVHEASRGCPYKTD